MTITDEALAQSRRSLGQYEAAVRTGNPVPDHPGEFAGSITITWPRADGPAMRGWQIAIADPAGAMITTVHSLAVYSRADDVVWARARMFAAPDGKPDPAGVHLDADGAPLMGTFDFLVAGMRVAPVPGSAWPDEAGL